MSLLSKTNKMNSRWSTGRASIFFLKMFWTILREDPFSMSKHSQFDRMKWAFPVLRSSPNKQKMSNWRLMVNPLAVPESKTNLRQNWMTSSSTSICRNLQNLENRIFFHFHWTAAWNNLYYVVLSAFSLPNSTEVLMVGAGSVGRAVLFGLMIMLSMQYSSETPASFVESFFSLKKTLKTLVGIHFGRRGGLWPPNFSGGGPGVFARGSPCPQYAHACLRDLKTKTLTKLVSLRRQWIPALHESTASIHTLLVSGTWMTFPFLSEWSRPDGVPLKLMWQGNESNQQVKKTANYLTYFNVACGSSAKDICRHVHFALWDHVFNLFFLGAKGNCCGSPPVPLWAAPAFLSVLPSKLAPRH